MFKIVLVILSISITLIKLFFRLWLFNPKEHNQSNRDHCSYNECINYSIKIFDHVTKINNKQHGGNTSKDTQDYLDTFFLRKMAIMFLINESAQDKLEGPNDIQNTDECKPAFGLTAAYHLWRRFSIEWSSLHCICDIDVKERLLVLIRLWLSHLIGLKLPHLILIWLPHLILIWLTHLILWLSSGWRNERLLLAIHIRSLSVWRILVSRVWVLTLVIVLRLHYNVILIIINITYMGRLIS